MAHCVHCGTQMPEEGSFCNGCGKAKFSGVGSGTAVQVAREEEKSFLREGSVAVTNTRFIVPGKTYAMAGITSVRFQEIPAKRAGAFLLCLGGLLLMAIVPLVGVILLAIGILWCFVVKTKYAVALSSSSGEVHAIDGTNEKFIRSIVEALNEAIIYRR